MQSSPAMMTPDASDNPALSSSSAEAVASNNDLLNEILLRLPARSLFKFKFVSKQWFSLITHPNFYRHYHNSRRTPSGLFLRRLSTHPYKQHEFLPLIDDDPPLTPPFRSLKFVPDPSDIVIQQSCNGLLLCSSITTNMPTNIPLKKYYIYNPSTNQFVSIPMTHSGVFDLHLSLAFDPAKSPHYKVVCVGMCDSGKVQIKIYSSETGVWQVSGKLFAVGDEDQFCGGAVYCNGAIHWYSDWGKSLYFNIEQEQVRRLPRHPMAEDWEDRKLLYFGESNNYLHLVEVYNHRSPQLDVYELGSDYSGWFVKYKVDLGPVAAVFPEMIVLRTCRRTGRNYYNFVLLSIIRGETEVESFLVLHIQCKIIQYNFVDRNFKVLRDYGRNRAGFLCHGRWSRALPFIESLARV